MKMSDQKLESITDNIKGLHSSIERLIAQFQQVIHYTVNERQPNLDKKSGSYWRQTAFADSLERVRLFLEQNFNYVETMGLLAVTRYLFELTVWIKLMQGDGEYGLVYYRELLKNQLKYWKNYHKHIDREIQFLREVAVKENGLLKKRLNGAIAIADTEEQKQALLGLGQEVMDEIDNAAVRRFSIYAEQAQTNGYDFQAHLVEKEVVPEIKKSMFMIEQELTSFEQNHPNLKPRKWQWRKQSKLVDMEDEYDFIYTNTSKLLHAMPSSITTSCRNLESGEMLIYLKYIHVRLLDLIEMAKQYLAEENSRKLL